MTATPSEAARKIAEELVCKHELCFMESAGPEDISHVMKQLRDSIALALTVPAGFVRGEDGVDRKVLGTLPLTADGCVVGMGCPKLWHPDSNDPSYEPEIRAWFDEMHFHVDEVVGGYEEIINLYSIRAAAESARDAKEKL